uniref:Uncharacterized protein n=1 Tax=Octopus bimaculoides TaxID=37653 RepID=A0A0L8I402_OCTBM
MIKALECIKCRDTKAELFLLSCSVITVWQKVCAHVCGALVIELMLGRFLKFIVSI